MEFKEIQQLAALMRDTGLTSLEYTEGVSSIKMERSSVAGVVPPEAAAPVVETAAAPAPEADDGIYTVTSPTVGVFYAAPAADKAPYVSLGDHVKAGDVLCIVEAMKMMNEIIAEKSGVVNEICVSNKQVVEYGHPLFRLSPD